MKRILRLVSTMLLVVVMAGLLLGSGAVPVVKAHDSLRTMYIYVWGVYFPNPIACTAYVGKPDALYVANFAVFSNDNLVLSSQTSTSGFKSVSFYADDDENIEVYYWRTDDNGWTAWSNGQSFGGCETLTSFLYAFPQSFPYYCANQPYAILWPCR